jgi:pSer/pThr/pTyr-binding forkhead associated (FHA) protein
VIGRQASCDFFVDDPTVSKHHADLRRAGDDWLLVDAGSRNGTRVNGWRVREVALRDGDVIRLGDAELVFSEPAAS